MWYGAKVYRSIDSSEATAALHCVDAFYGPTHDRARLRDTRRSSLQHLQRGAVRPVRGTGQTGRRAERRRSYERSPGRDPSGQARVGLP